MFSSVEYIREICKQRNIPISTLESECGFANGYLNPKKLKKLPYDRAVKIGQYLGVSVEFLLTGEEKEEASFQDGERKIDGRRIKALREARGLTLEQVGDFIGVNKATIQRYEIGNIDIKRNVAIKLAECLGTSPSYIMGWTDDPLAAVTSATPAALSPQLQALADALDQLNEEGQEKLLDYAADLVAGGRYKKVPLSLLENKNTAAARSGDRMNVASVSAAEEEAALPSSSHNCDI